MVLVAHLRDSRFRDAQVVEELGLRLRLHVSETENRHARNSERVGLDDRVGELLRSRLRVLLNVVKKLLQVLVGRLEIGVPPRRGLGLVRRGRGSEQLVELRLEVAHLRVVVVVDHPLLEVVLLTLRQLVVGVKVLEERVRGLVPEALIRRVIAGHIDRGAGRFRCWPVVQLVDLEHRMQLARLNARVHSLKLVDDVLLGHSHIAKELELVTKIRNVVDRVLEFFG